MLSPPEKLGSEGFSFIRIWCALLFLSVVFGNSFYVVANSPKHSRLGIGINERRWAEQRLWELGYFRVPMFAAKELSALMPMGIEVSVYG